MYRRILAPTDGNEPVRTALEHAVDLAARYGAVLHVVYAVDTRAIPTGPRVDSPPRTGRPSGHRERVT